MKNIGDVVHIRSDLVEHEDYGSDIVVGKMLEFCGAQSIIKDIEDGEYILDVDNGEWYWTDEMLED